MLLDWIYPPRCIACGMLFAPVHNKPRPWLCESCRPLLTPAPCTPEYENLHAAFLYDETLRDMLHEIKFRNKRQTAEGLGHILAESTEAESLPKADYIVPIPMHPAKKRARGFNQAEIIARPLSKKLNIPIARDMLRRVKNTRPQAGLSGRSRRHNLEGAFSFNAKKYSRGVKSVLLLDDIFTSGATIGACAGVLAENGILDIYTISLSIALSDKFTNL